VSYNQEEYVLDKMDDKNIIKSNIKIFHLLEILVDNGKLSLGELSQLTGYSKSSTQRIVNTLKHMKYINQDKKNNEYYPAAKLYDLGSRVINNISIKNVSKQYLLELRNMTNETVNLGMLNEDSVIYIDKIVSNSPLRIELELGIRFPIYCSALGKSIAAFVDEEITFSNKYIKYTENTISSDEELKKELITIKKQGYAIDNEEYVPGLVCISVPILNLSGYAIASISISIPAFRYDNNQIDYYVNLLKETARKIQGELF